MAREQQQQANSQAQRLRITFGKLGSQKYIGHLDLAKTWERILRRAEISLSYSQGFSAHPKIQLATALPLGITSECELMDVWLDHPIPLDGLADHLMSVSPPGLPVYKIEEIPAKAPSLPSLLMSAVYVFTPLIEIDDLAQRVSDFLAQTRVVRTRRDRPYDLRPLVLDLKVEADNKLRVEMIQTEQGAGRPDELIEALGLHSGDFNVHRVQIKLSKART